MDAAPLVAIVVTVLLLIGLAVWGARRRAAIQLEETRYRASETRDQALATQVEADRLSAEADERAARAERERLASEQQRVEAQRQHEEAADLRRAADEIDPDIDVDAEADADVVDLDAADGDEVDQSADPYTVDLREARAAKDASSRSPDAHRREG
jgi:FtsZ-interacting cell division protein ZipA